LLLCHQPEPVPLGLAADGLGQFGDELDRPGVLVRGDRGPGELLQLGHLGLVRRGALPQHHVSLYDHAAAGVGRADDGHLEHVRVAEQRLLDLGPGDVIARRDDHVVAARLEPEVAVGVADIGVAGDVPTVLHVAPLPAVGQVAAASRALDGEPSRRAVGHLRAVLVQDHRPVARHGPAGRAGPDVVVGGRDEHVQHLRGADAVDDRQARSLAELLPHRLRQVLAGRHAAAQVLQRGGLPGRQHGPVGGRRRGQHGHAAGGDRVGQFGRGGPLEQQGCRARPEREQQQAAEPVGEAERGSAGEHVVPARLDQVSGEGVAGGQDVPVEVHGHLGLAGGARGGGEHGHVVGRGVHRGERALLARAAGGQPRRIVRIAAVGDRGQL
jgi:hypothetical protein